MADSTRYGATEAGRDLASFGGDTHKWAQVQLVHVLDNLYRGVERVALYQLINTDGWGFFNTSFQPLAAATALRNLLSYVSDAHVNDPVGWSYGVTDPAATVLSLSMRDSSGQQFLALWSRRSTLTRDVALTLSTAEPVSIVRPVTSGATENRGSATAHAISLGDNPVLVRVG